MGIEEELLRCSTFLLGNKGTGMKLYVIINGYQGSGVVKVYVVAKNEERAMELARAKFKEETERPGSPYDESYYVDLEVEWRCENLKEEWVSEIADY